MTYEGLAPGIFSRRTCNTGGLGVLRSFSSYQAVSGKAHSCSWLFPSLRYTWLLKIIMHFRSEKWTDSSTDSSGTSSANEDTTYMFMEFAMKSCCFPETWYEGLHQTYYKIWQQ